MVKILINHTTVLPTTQDKNGNNLLHNMAFSCLTSNQKAILDLLLVSKSSFSLFKSKVTRNLLELSFDQGSHSHGKSGKVMEKFAVMESQGKVMENQKNIKNYGKVKILP